MTSFFSGTSPSFGGNAKDAQERKPFAPLQPATEAARPAFGAPPTPPASRVPLFPPRDGNDAPRPLFPRPGETGAVAPPRAPLFPKPAVPGAGSTLFPHRADPAKTPAAPLFPRRDPVSPPLGAPAGAAPGAAPFFGARPLAGSGLSSGLAGGQKTSFGTAPSRPVFGTTPILPSTTPTFATPPVGRETKISDEEFILLRDFLYQQSGIYIAENRKYLVENRLASRLRDLGLRSFGEYYKYLRYDANRATEMNKLYENMTTNETSFFRNQPQLDVFRDKVLIKLLTELRAKGQKKLRIWSAGCSSGEEPYTLAIILYEVLKQEIDSWDIKITANDLSLAMLSAARRGLYNDYAIRTTPADMLARYFTREGSLYRIDPKLQRLVSFGQINLSDKLQLQKVDRSQIVFCRNVIIYFDDDMKRNVINSYYDNLLPGGYLIIGHSESLHNISRAFKPEHYTGSIVYCKQN